MTSANLINPEDKMLQIYIQNLQKTVESLCKIINTLVTDDQIIYDAYQTIKQILGQIKYYEKFNNKQNLVSKIISQTVTVIGSHSQHQPSLQVSKQDYLPPVKSFQNANPKNLTTIAQKQSEQSILQNYIRKQSQRKNISKYLKTNKGNIKTINEPVSYLNTSREFEIIREQTRRSLDNQGMSSDKKTLYKELQKMKGTEQIFPAVKDYLDKHNHKKQVTSKSPNYTITKFI